MEKLRTFISDRKKTLPLVISVFLCIFNTYQFADSHFMTVPGIKALCFFAFSLAVLIKGERAIPLCFALYGYIIMQFSDFTQYWPFIAVTVFTIYREKFTVPCMFLYLMDILIVCTRHGKTGIHVAIHILSCALIYLIIRGLRELLEERTLSARRHYWPKPELTEQEKYILSQMKEGKLQKEIPGYSENTVCRKLREARMRNGIPTTEELLMRFIYTE